MTSIFAPREQPDPAQDGSAYWRYRFAERDRRQRRTSGAIILTVAILWGLFLAGLAGLIGGSGGLGSLFGFLALAFTVLPLSGLTLAALLFRGWLARRSGRQALTPAGTAVRSLFAAHFGTIEATLRGLERGEPASFTPEEVRAAEIALARLGVSHATVLRPGAGAQPSQITALGRDIAALVKTLDDLHQAVVERAVDGALPLPFARLPRGRALPRIVAIAAGRLETALAALARCDEPRLQAATRRAQDSAQRALASVGLSAALDSRVALHLAALTEEVEAVPRRGRTDPETLLAIEERLLKARWDHPV